MHLRLSSTLAVLIFTASASCAQAQGIQNWINNEAGKIQQEAGSGAISPGQAAQLQNRDAQIQSQEQQYLNQNGGVLTPQEQRQLSSETRHLNQNVNGDVMRNNPAANLQNGWFPHPLAPGQVAPPGWNPNYPAAQQGQNPYYHHHHHHNQYPNSQYPNNPYNTPTNNPYYNPYHQ